MFLKRIVAIIAALFILILTRSCFEFRLINQPLNANPNSSFEVDIILEASSYDWGGRLYFGINLPDGWTVDDSIFYVHEYGLIEGVFTYSPEYTEIMNLGEEVKEGYHWWVAASSDSLEEGESPPEGSYSFKLRINTDDKSGIFFLDYMNTIFRQEDSYTYSLNHPVSVGSTVTLTVTNTNDYGEGSLRDAIEKTLWGGDIEFDFEMPDTIELNSTLVINKSLDIIGPASGELTISGQNKCRVFDLIGAYVKTHISLSNFTIKNGFSEEDGGGIQLTDMGMTLTDVNLTLTDVSIRECTSAYGGGIYWAGDSLSLKDVTISDNLAEREGGGIYIDNDDSYAELDNVIIDGNSAQQSGGGIYLSSRSANFKNTTIKNNWAVNGGGIYIANDWSYNEISFESDMLSRSNIYLNMALTGRDIYYKSSNWSQSVYVDTFTVLNPSYHHVYSENYENKIRMYIQNSKIDQFEEDLFGKDLFVSSEGSDINSGTSPDKSLRTIFMAVSLIQPDTSKSCKIRISNGIYSRSANGEVFPVYIPDNVSLVGESRDSVILDAGGKNGGVIFDHVENSGIESMTITGSQESGIISDNSNPVLKDLIIENNYAENGGGIYFNYSDAELEDLVIKDNEAEEDGGGIHCAHSDPGMKDIIIENNQADNGGGIYYHRSALKLKDLILMDNEANSGGGIYCDDSDTELKDIIIENNTANFGGGIYFIESEAELDSVTIKNNTSMSGGGILLDRSDVNQNYVNIIGNEASTGSGIYLINSDSYIVNTTIHDNLVDIDDPFLGIYRGILHCRSSSKLVIVNSILRNDSGFEILFTSSGDSTIILHSNIEDGIFGINTNDSGTVHYLYNNMDSDPLFVDPENGDYNLQKDSPCIDAGIVYYSYWDKPLIGLAPDEYIGSKPDIGAHEYDPSTEPEIIPDKFIILQNYPNPFNPSTTIEYSIPVISRQYTVDSKQYQESSIRNQVSVSLIVYDILGREVATLVNEHQRPGNYKVQFDAAGLSSGVYFYKLTAGQFVDTKKLMLLK